MVSQIEEATAQAFNLSFNATYPTPVTIPLFLQRAFLNARNLAVQSSYVTADTIQDILRNAYSQMIGLSSRIRQINPDAAPPESS